MEEIKLVLAMVAIQGIPFGFGYYFGYIRGRKKQTP